MVTYGPGRHSLRCLFLFVFLYFPLAIFEVDIRLHIFFGDWADFLAILTLKAMADTVSFGFSSIYSIFSLFFKNLYFEIIVDSHATVRNIGGIMYVLHPVSPKVTSSIIIVQNNTINRKLTSIIYWSVWISSVLYVLICLYVYLFYVISSCDICVFHYYHQIRTVHHYQDPLCCYFVSIGPISNPWEPLICSFSFQEYYIN